MSHVVVVDDGSADRTSETALEAGATVLRHLMNRGQGAALQTGIEYSLKKGADVIVTFDADGQHDAADVAALLHPIVDGFADVVLGSRFLGKAENMPLSRWVVLKCGLVFTRWTSGLKLTDTHNGLRAFSRRAAQHVRFINDRMAHASELMDLIRKNKLHYLEVPVHVRYTEQTRKKGQSGLNAPGYRVGLFSVKVVEMIPFQLYAFIFIALLILVGVIFIARRNITLRMGALWIAFWVAALIVITNRCS